HTKIRDKQSRRDHAANGCNPAGIAHQITVIGEQVGRAGHYGGCPGRSTDEEIDWDLLGPLRLFEHGNAVVSGFRSRFGEWSPYRQGAFAADCASFGGFTADFRQACFAVLVRNSIWHFRKGNAAHRRLSPRNANNVAPNMAPAATAADVHAFF